MNLSTCLLHRLFPRAFLGFGHGSLGFLSLLLAASLHAQSTPPNILLIAVDDLRPQLGAYGVDHVHSPNMDRLAEESSLFARAYCNVPVCGASRATLMGGLRPGRHRYLHFYTWLERETPQVLPLNTFLQQAGYRTVSLGKVYHNPGDASDGWDHMGKAIGTSGWRDYVDPANIALDQAPRNRGPAWERLDVPDDAYRDGRLAEMAIEELQQAAGSDQPLFLALGFVKPHLPFNAPEKYWDLYDRNALPLPPGAFLPENAPQESFHSSGELRAYHGIPKQGHLSDDQARTLVHGYHACVSYIDALIGKVLRALDDTGLADNTIVILWGDHGWNLREHGLWCKHCNYETSLHIPLMIKAPGIAPARVEAIAETVDIYPTLCQLAGLPAPVHLEGQDLSPLMRDPSLPGDGIAVCKWFDGITLIKDHIFYTEWRDEDDQVYARMLYDHQTDPEEQNNLAATLHPQSLLDELSALLERERGPHFFDPVFKPSRQ